MSADLALARAVERALMDVVHERAPGPSSSAPHPIWDTLCGKVVSSQQALWVVSYARKVGRDPCPRCLELSIADGK